MRKALIARFAVSVVALSLWGCGVADDFEANSRLVVTSVTSAAGANTVVANALEKTDDSGTDGTAGTNDPDGTENNGLPDPGETVEVALSNDLGTISFKNDPRGATGSGVDLTVYRIDITYLDGNRQSRTFAPSKIYNVSLLVPTEATAELIDVILVPVDMKYGVRDIFISPPSAAALTAVRDWTAIIDIYAKDPKNNNDVHTQAKVSIHFINPMVEG